MVSQLDPMITSSKGTYYVEKEQPPLLPKVLGPEPPRRDKEPKPDEALNEDGIITTSF